MSSYQKYLNMSIKKVIEYLDGEKSVCEDALKAYDDTIIPDTDAEIRSMREREAIKLRDRITELSRHIKVIKAMFPE